MSLLPEPGIEPVLPVGLIAFEERDMDRCLDGSVVAITGARRGIGAATARLLAARGAPVVLGSRGEQALASTADAITVNGVRWRTSAST